MCLWVSVCTSLAREARRWYRIPWCGSSSMVWLTQHRCWETNLAPLEKQFLGSAFFPHGLYYFIFIFLLSLTACVLEASSSLPLPSRSHLHTHTQVWCNWGNVVALILAFWGTSTLTTTVEAHVYTLTSSLWACLCLYILPASAVLFRLVLFWCEPFWLGWDRIPKQLQFAFSW